MLLDEKDDLLSLDPEVQDYIDFRENDEQDNTGFLTRKDVDKNRSYYGCRNGNSVWPLYRFNSQRFYTLQG